MHNKASETGYTTPYKFTGKELDPETGLYYYGARYYDPVLSRWVSTDPPMMTGEYFPTEELWKKEAEEKQQLTANYPFKNDFLENHPNVATTAHLELPGLGGVFNPINLDAYQYAGHNPVKLVDPDGNSPVLAGTFGLGALVGAGYNCYKVYATLGKNARGGDYLSAATIGGLSGAAMVGVSMGLPGAHGFLAAMKIGAVNNMVMQSLLSQGGEIDLKEAFIAASANAVMLGKGVLLKKYLPSEADRQIVDLLTEAYNQGGASALVDVVSTLVKKKNE